MRSILRRFFRKAKKQPDPDRSKEAELYNSIGAAALDNVGRDDVSVLLFVERVEGGMNHCLRFSQPGSPHFSGVHTDNNLASALWRLDESVEAQPAETRWSAMEYLIEDGEIDVKFSYDPIDEEIPFWERTPAILEKYFPGKTSDTAK